MVRSTAAAVAVLAVLAVARSQELDVGLDPADIEAGDECAALQVRGTRSAAPRINDTDGGGSTCSRNTQGSCRFSSCHESRGPAECERTLGYQCHCPAGWCATNGACSPGRGKCSMDTGGSCSWTGSCSSTRGQTECVKGKCMCKAGHCVYKGKCYPNAVTGGSCSVLNCAHSRGPTSCVDGQCICRRGYVSVDGECRKDY